MVLCISFPGCVFPLLRIPCFGLPLLWLFLRAFCSSGLAASHCDSHSYILMFQDILVQGTELHINLCMSKMAEYIAIWPATSGTSLVHANDSYLSQFQFTGVIWAYLVCQGFPQRDFDMPSFWIGATTLASEVGLSFGHVKVISDWCSSEYKFYVRLKL